MFPVILAVLDRDCNGGTIIPIKDCQICPYKGEHPKLLAFCCQNVNPCPRRAFGPGVSVGSLSQNRMGPASTEAAKGVFPQMTLKQLASLAPSGCNRWHQPEQWTRKSKIHRVRGRNFGSPCIPELPDPVAFRHLVLETGVYNGQRIWEPWPSTTAPSKTRRETGLVWATIELIWGGASCEVFCEDLRNSRSEVHSAALWKHRSGLSQQTSSLPPSKCPCKRRGHHQAHRLQWEMAPFNMPLCSHCRSLHVPLPNLTANISAFVTAL